MAFRTKEEFIKDLEENIYCRLRPSSVHGTGVFAIRDIPQGVNPFLGAEDHGYIEIPRAEILENPRIRPEVKAMVQDFFAEQEGILHCPPHSLNAINISYFVNHSEDPNLESQDKDGTFYFVARRDIKAGEELTADYNHYSDAD